MNSVHSTAKTKGLWMILALALLLSAPAAWASGSGVSSALGGDLDLREALRLSYDNNKAILQARAAVKAAQSRGEQAISAFLPRLDLQAGYSYTDNPVMVFGDKMNQADFRPEDFSLDRLNNPDYRGNYQTKIVLTQPVFNQGTEIIGYRMAKTRERLAALEMAKAVQAVLYRVEKAYCDTLLAQEKVEALEIAKKTALEHEALAKRRYEAGLVLKSDLLGARVQSGRVERELIQARNDYRLALSALNQAMGLPLDTQWHLEGLDSEMEDEGDLAFWLETAEKSRPEILLAGVRQRLVELRRRQAQFRFLPSMNLQGWYENDRHNLDRDGGESWTFMAVMTFNLFNGLGDLRGLEAAEAELEGSTASYEEVRSQVELEVREAFYGFKTAKKQLEVARSAVEQAKESQRILRNRYENGLALMVELLSADTVLRQEMLNEARARFEARLAWAALKWKAGILGRTLGSLASRPSHETGGEPRQ